MDEASIIQYITDTLARPLPQAIPSFSMAQIASYPLLHSQLKITTLTAPRT
jgi:hypothetical protein